MGKETLPLLFSSGRSVSTKTLLRHWKTLVETYRITEITLRSCGCETKDSQQGQALSRACPEVVVRILDHEGFLLVVYKKGGRL